MITDIGYAPILLCIIVFQTILFINSVVAGTLKIACQFAMSHIHTQYLSFSLKMTYHD